MIPNETGYSRTDMDAYNEMLAIRYGKHHHRLKMLKIVERSRSEEVGRALNGDFHLRVDEFGNPEVTFRKKEVILRMAYGGIRIFRPTHYYDMSSAIDQFTRDPIVKWSTYTYDHSGLRPKNLKEQMEELNIDHHGYGDSRFVSSFPKPCANQNCEACDHLRKWVEYVDAEAKKYKEAVVGLTVTPGTHNDDNGRKVGIGYDFIPYAEEVPEADVSWLPPLISKEWEKIQRARSWNRRKDSGQEAQSS